MSQHIYEPEKSFLMKSISPLLQDISNSRGASRLALPTAHLEPPTRTRGSGFRTRRAGASAARRLAALLPSLSCFRQAFSCPRALLPSKSREALPWRRRYARRPSRVHTAVGQYAHATTDWTTAVGSGELATATTATAVGKLRTSHLDFRRSP